MSEAELVEIGARALAVMELLGTLAGEAEEFSEKWANRLDVAESMALKVSDDVDRLIEYIRAQERKALRERVLVAR